MQRVAVGWNPWTAIAEHDDLELMFFRLPIPGLYDPDRKVIVVATGQTATMRRSVAAEELAHHVLGHRPCPCHIETARMELQARRWAARKLMSIKHLSKAMVHAHCWDDIAEALMVDLVLVKERIGDLTDSEMRDLLHRIRTLEIVV